MTTQIPDTMWWDPALDDNDAMERDYAKYRAILWAAHRQDWDIERARRESLAFTNWLRKIAGLVPLEPPL